MIRCSSLIYRSTRCTASKPLKRTTDLPVRKVHLIRLPVVAIHSNSLSIVALMNLVECLVNFWYLYYATSKPQNPGRASLIGFTGAIMTASKTVLYWLVDFFAGMAHTGHNNLQNYILLWIVCVSIACDDEKLTFLSLRSPMDCWSWFLA